MKSTPIIVGAVLASLAIAQPHHNRHRHAARHEKEKRDQSVVWVTDWIYETETIDLTTTIWVTPGFVPPYPVTASAAASSSSSSGDAGQFLGTPATQVTPEITPSSIYIAPSSSYVVPSSSEAALAYTPPVETSTSINTLAYVAPTESSITAIPEPTTTAESITPPAETTTTLQAIETAAAAAPTMVISSKSYSGVCSSSSPCSGDITWYDVGLGACGLTNVATDLVVALPHGLMGTESNNNPYCGKTITVSYGGKSIIVTVVDKCMGCDDYAIDLSSSAFASLDSLDAGRVLASWYFND